MNKKKCKNTPLDKIVNVLKNIPGAKTGKEKSKDEYMKSITPQGEEEYQEEQAKWLEKVKDKKKVKPDTGN